MTPPAMKSATNNTNITGDSTTLPDVPLIQDTVTLMIVYTPAAAAWASANETSINNTISLLMVKAQLALDNSNTLMTIKLVYSAQVTYTELNNNNDLYNLTNNGDGIMDEVHTWRNTYCADVVVLLEQTDFTGGLGWLLNTTLGLPAYAFSLTRVQQASWTYTTVHEIGHNMGCHHHKLQNVQPGPGLFSYSAGWRWTGSSNAKYCSVMTYESGSYFPDGITHTRLAYFSNPGISYQGVPTGHSTDGDNAYTLRQIKAVVAAYRTGCNCNVTAPVVGNITHPSCILSTGSVILNGLPASGTWTLTRTPGGTTTTGTGTSKTITGLTAGTYTYKVTNSSGCVSASSANIVINVQPVTPAPTGNPFQLFYTGATVANLIATGINIQWYSFSTGGVPLSPSTILVNNNHYFASQTVNGCESTARFDVTVTVNIPPILTVTGNVGSNVTTCYNATQTITVAGGATTFNVQIGGNATLIAGQNIIFLPGTWIKNAGHMRGYISTIDHCGLKTSSILTDVNEEYQYPFQSNKSSIKLYPNPTTGKFTIEQPEGYSDHKWKVEIFGMHGKRLISAEITGERKHEFSLSDIPKGLYFVTVHTNDYIETFKLLLTP